MIFLKQFFLLAFLLTSSLIQIQAADKKDFVYRWVDKHGVVHYSDKAKNKSAVLVDIKKTTANSFIDSNIALPTIEQETEQAINDSKKLSEEDKQYCKYLKEQIRLANEAVEMGNELRVNYASAYLKTSDKLLKDNRCL